MSDGSSTPGARAEPRIDSISNARRKRQATLVLSATAIVAIAAWMYGRYTNLVLDDARFMGLPALLASPCDCSVSAVLATEASRSTAGTTVVVLDSEELEYSLVEAQARVDAAQATVARLTQEIVALKGEVRREALSISADAASAGEALDISAETLELSEHKLTRARQLLADQLVSRSDFERTEAELLEARRAHNSASIHARQSLIERGRASESAALIAARGMELQERRAELRALGARVSQIRSQLARRRVRLPFDATVDRVFVHPGDRVMEGRRLMLVHDPRAVYLEANIQETDLRYVHAGMKVAVSVDGLPDRDFEGVVKAVGTSTTSQFGLLPATAPNGSFVKIVQRIPVRIAVRVQEGLLRPGMQAEVRIARSIL
ncbi:HlyD family secretion protein [Lysobacter fragariae]